MHQVLIKGSWLDALSGASHDIRNPATLQSLGAAADCGVADVERAVAAATAAQAAWAATAIETRMALLASLATEVRAHATVLAPLLTQETGKPLAESYDCTGWAADCLAAGKEPAPPASASRVIGVCPTGDFPLLRMAATIGPAVAAGCTVICKPPRGQPLASLRFAELCSRFPPGVINLLTGGEEVTTALAAHPGVADGIAERSLRECVPAERLALDPILVCRDADLELAVAGVAWARLLNGGQTVGASRSVYVEAPVARDFAERMHAYVAFLEAGNPSKPETDLGPLLTHEAARHVEAQVARALKEGAVLKLGGRAFRPWGLSGHFVQPTVMTHVLNGNSATRDPIRGPVVAITPVADVKEAITLLTVAGHTQGLSYYSARSPSALAAPFPATWELQHVTTSRTWWYPYAARSRPGI